MKSQQQGGRRHHKTKPVDGIIVEAIRPRSGRADKRWIQHTWVLTASPDESLADFFLEDYDAPSQRTATHKPVICRGIAADGTLILDRIHLASDRFLSEIFASEAEK